MIGIAGIHTRPDALKQKDRRKQCGGTVARRVQMSQRKTHLSLMEKFSSGIAGFAIQVHLSAATLACCEERER